MQPTHSDSVQWVLEVDKKDIAYIVGLFEGYDDLAVVRTIDPQRAHVELIIAPDYLEVVQKLLDHLHSEIPFRIVTPEPN